MAGKTVVLNGDKINFDGKMDYTCLSEQVTVYGCSQQEEILDRVQDQEIVITKELPLPASLLSCFPPSVKLICEAGTGYNNIHLPTAAAKGITVCNVPAYSTQRVAHTAIMLLLNLSSSMGRQLAMLDRGDRSNFTGGLQVEHREVNGKTLGIIGAGTIGKEMIKIALVLGMDVLVYTRTPGPEQRHVRYTTLEQVLTQSDYLSLHCPLTDETRHIINYNALKKMKPSAFLINTARGPLVDQKALEQALLEGRLAGAGLDVQEQEPLPEDSLLYRLDNVILTPHMGWKGLETRMRLMKMLKENITAYLLGAPIHVVSEE